MIKTSSSFMVLYCADIDKTVKFYKSVGAEITKVEDIKCVIVLGDFELHFCSTEPVEAYRGLFKRPFGGSFYLYAEVDNIQEMYQNAQNSNISIKTAISETPWETKEFLCEDPDGYNVIFYQEM